MSLFSGLLAFSINFRILDFTYSPFPSLAKGLKYPSILVLSVQSAPTGTSNQFFSLLPMDSSKYSANFFAILVFPVPLFPVSITNGFARREVIYL